jgi:hypothetical protein
MGSFNDLPKDVVWLIFRWTIIKQSGAMSLKIFEEGMTRLCFSPSDAPSLTSCQICKLACVSRSCLKVVHSKCYRVSYGFLFKKGSFTT